MSDDHCEVCGVVLQRGQEKRCIAHGPADTPKDGLRDETDEPRELLCEDCGRDYAVWFAPNDLWNRVRGHHGGGMICPTCFTMEAERKGIVPTAWKIDIENASSLEIDGGRGIHFDATRNLDSLNGLGASPSVASRPNQVTDEQDGTREGEEVHTHPGTTHPNRKCFCKCSKLFELNAEEITNLRATISDLTAQVADLRADNERLTRERDAAQSVFNSSVEPRRQLNELRRLCVTGACETGLRLLKTFDKQREINTDLRAEVERLRAALAELLRLYDGSEAAPDNYPTSRTRIEMIAAWEVARALLTGKDGV